MEKMWSLWLGKTCT